MKTIDIQNFIADIQNSSGYWEEMAIMDFAVMLNDEMQKQGISKSQLAKKTGVSKAYISKVLGGTTANFTLRSMAKLMFAIGKKLCFFCKNIDEENSSDEIYSWTLPEVQVQSSSNLLDTEALQAPLTENVLTIQNSVKSKSKDSSAYKSQVAA